MRPERFDVNPESSDAADQWNHWYFTFNNFLSSMESLNPDKLMMLANHISPSVYKSISEYASYEDAIDALEKLYIKPKNEVFARHLLSTAKQDSNQSLDQFLQHLRSLANECNLQPVSKEQYRDELIRDAFIRGITSGYIRQRLLELGTLDLHTAFSEARQLEIAQKNASSYVNPSYVACISNPSNSCSPSVTNSSELLSAVPNTTCFFCGRTRHSRINCPARNAICKKCGKKGHFQSVCRSSQHTHFSASTDTPIISSLILASAPTSLSNAVISIYVNGVLLQALIDTGSSESYLSKSVLQNYNWNVVPSQTLISMASTSLSKLTHGHCIVDISYKGAVYKRVKLSVLPDLCSDIILGHDFLKLHKGVELQFPGSRPPIACGLLAARVEPLALFAYLSPDCKPIATKSRRHSHTDQLFINEEIRNLLDSNIIEPSNSPWRAQVLVTTNEKHRKRLVIDYSQTINRYIYLDAHPFPRIDEMIERISRYTVFSTLDLTSAYHQIPIKPSERNFTAFEAGGKLYQFLRIPFGVTNGVACFQRTIDSIITAEHLSATFAYVDNVTICGSTMEEHDANLSNFLAVTEKYCITLNESKNILRVSTIKLLGYQVSHRIIQPDPDRLAPLRDLAPPQTIKAQQRIVGLFSYNSQWIPRFSDKINPLVHNQTFPLPQNVLESFHKIKQELESAAIVTIEPGVPLVVETDASELAIAATLNQNGRPVAFFSRSLTSTEKHHSAIEKEACAIVEALRKWRHFLISSHLKLVTDQRSVAFMFDNSRRSKIKNDKIQRWRTELSCFHSDISY